MSVSFQFTALDPKDFPEFNKLQAESANSRWLTADHHPGFPCRVSLQDAQPGEQVLAISYAHHPVASPYRASGPVFIRQSTTQATPEVNEVPEFLDHRVLSVRAYDAAGMMRDACVVKGGELEPVLQRMLGDDLVDYLHIHNAGPGCFMCGVERVDEQRN